MLSGHAFRVGVSALIAVLLGAGSATAALTFTDLGHLGGGTSDARAISADGTLVAGNSTNGSGQTEAFLWKAGAMVPLGFPGDPGYSSAVAIDALPGDVVKLAVNGTLDGDPWAYLWSGNSAGAGTYVASLRFSNGYISEASGIIASDTDVTVCGFGNRIDWNPGCGNYHGWRYKQSSATCEDVGALPDGSYPVRCMGISSDLKLAGTAQFGSTTNCAGTTQAFIWSEGTFTIVDPIVGPPSTTNAGVGNAISRNGAYVVGRSHRTAAGDWQAFRGLGGAGNTIGIPYLPGDTYSEALAVSGDGSRVGGYSGEYDRKAFIWDPANSTQNVRDLLAAAGVNMTGWMLTEVRAISDDGTTIAGVGTYDPGTGAAFRGWLVGGLSLQPPEPPRVEPVLYASEGTANVTVTGVLATATAVTLYKNTSEAVGTVNPAGQTTVAVPVPSLAAGDYYTATQTTPTGTSTQTPMGRCVQPLVLSFADNFDVSPLKLWWLECDLALSTEQAHGGAGWSIKEPVSGGFNAADLTPARPSSVDNPILFEFWMYDAGTSGTAARHYGSIAQYADGYWVPAANPVWVYEAGAISDIAKNPYDATRYQGRAVKTGVPNNTYEFNLARATSPGGHVLAPTRSPGWHKFSIKHQGSSAVWYVDGKYGYKQTGAQCDNLCAVQMGSDRGASPDGNPAYYDEVAVARVMDHGPTVTLVNINAVENRPIAPTNEYAADVDTPDTMALGLYSFPPLPAGVTASVNGVPVTITSAVQVIDIPSSLTAGPSATLTIAGTPPTGSAGTYTVTVRPTDDGGHTVLAPANAFTLTITDRPPCNTPPQDADGDNDVDLTDFNVFQSCFNGPNRPYQAGAPQEECQCLDIDPDDGDVDLGDFNAFQACFNGPNRPASCG